jgi:hypothetical protein
MMALGGLHEELHIIRQMPGQVIIFSNDKIF